MESTETTKTLDMPERWEKCVITGVSDIWYDLTETLFSTVRGSFQHHPNTHDITITRANVTAEPDSEFIEQLQKLVHSRPETEVLFY